MAPIKNNIAKIRFLNVGLEYALKLYDYEFNMTLSELMSGNIKFIDDKKIFVTKKYTKVVGIIADIITISIKCSINKKELEYVIEVSCDGKKSYIKNY
jgi:hypothetical protein